MLSISIIIPAYNETRVIERAINSILNSIQTYSGSYEIIVVDNNSTDTTATIVKEITKKYPQVHLVSEKQKGVSFARNKGAAVAKGDYLLFLDADSQLSPHFITHSITEIIKRNLHAATCYAKAHTNKYRDRVFLYPLNLIVALLQHTPRPVALGAAVWIQRVMHHKIGGFHTEMYYGEDSYYVTNAKKHGRFGMLHTTFLFDMRRIYREGKLVSVIKSIKGFARHIMFGSTKGVKFEYNTERSESKEEIRDARAEIRDFNEN